MTARLLIFAAFVLAIRRAYRDGVDAGYHRGQCDATDVPAGLADEVELIFDRLPGFPTGPGQ